MTPTAAQSVVGDIHWASTAGSYTTCRRATRRRVQASERLRTMIANLIMEHWDMIKSQGQW